MEKSLMDMRQKALDILHYRHACKKFDDFRHIPDEDFALILEAARLAPSSFGFEPWQFVVIRNTDLLEKLRPYAWGAINCFNGASHFVVLLARKEIDLLSDAAYVERIMREVQKLPPERIARKKVRYATFLKDDFELLGNDRAIFDWACKQTYIALANMMMVAAMLSIDSCPVEGFIRGDVERVLAEEGVLDRQHYGVAVMAGFGYRAVQPPVKTRQPVESVIRWV